MAEIHFDERMDSTDAESVEVQRHDVATLASPQRTREGFLRAQGILTRAGVFEYPEHGTRELRAPEEIFAPESMTSFALMPVTANHPPKLLTPSTVRDYQVGSVGTPEQVGTVMRADVLITDPRTIDDVMSGRNKLSLGYSSKVVKRSGTFVDDDGKEYRFDSVQTAIRGNHLAIITSGDSPRAGDVAALRIDSKKGKTMKIKIGAFEFDAPDEHGAEIQKRLDAMSSELSTAQGQIAALKSEAEKNKAESERQARLDAQGAELEARMQLILSTQPILNKPVSELARMDAVSLMRSVVAKERPDVKLDGRDEAFVKGAFEIVMSDLSKRVDSASKLRESQNAAGTVAPRTDAKSKIDEAFARQNDRAMNAWKPKTAA